MVKVFGNMDIQEQIRRILKEELLREGMFVSPYVKNKIDYVDDYIINLDSGDICNHWVVDEVDEYVNSTMSDIVRNIIDNYSSEINSENYNSKYDEIYEFLVNLGYTEQIRNFFYESIDNC